MRYNHRSVLALQSTGHGLPSGGVTLVESRPELRGTREQQHDRPFGFKLGDLGGENGGTMQIFDRERIWTESGGHLGVCRQSLVLENNVPERRRISSSSKESRQRVAHTERG